MGINFIGRTVLLAPTPATTIDLPGIDVQAGDLLIFGAGYGHASYTRANVTDVGTGTITFVRPTTTYSGNLSYQGLSGYNLACPLTATGVVFRFTWSSAPTAVDMVFVEVWRPTAGVVMQLDAAPAYITNAGTLTPTSPLVTTTTRALVWGLCVVNSASVDKTNPLIAGASADMYPAAPSTSRFTARLAQAFATAQANIAAQFTLAVSNYIAFGIHAFREYSTTVNQTITCRGITLGVASANQEVFVGGIG